MANTYNICNKLQAIADAITQGGGGGGGTTVIANPSGTPTADLNTVQIGQVIYDIPGGGGGSGYSETTLWSGAPTTTSITLSDSVLNYDAIYCEAMFNNEAIIVETIDKATFTTYLGNDYISLGAHGSTYYGITPASDDTNFVLFGANYNGCTRVIGLKYARGGGSDEAIDINYDNTTSGLTATNVQDAIDENADNISTLNSKLTTTSDTLQTNEILYKYGNVRVLAINGATTDATGKLATIPSDDRPSGNIIVQTVILDSTNKLYNGYLTIDNIGLVSIRYYVAQTTTDAAVGANHRIYTSASWVV